MLKSRAARRKCCGAHRDGKSSFALTPREVSPFRATRSSRGGSGNAALARKVMGALRLVEMTSYVYFLQRLRAAEKGLNEVRY